MPTMTSTVARGNGPFPTVNLVQRPRPLGWMQRVEDGHQECVPLYYQGNTRVVINGPTMRHHEPLLPGSTLAVESAPGYTYSAGLEFAKPQPWSLLPSHATLARSANATATPAESATSQSTIAPHNEVRETSMMSPTCLSCPSTDDHFLNDFQTVLRLHIEAFAASPVDVQSRSRGRGKRIQLHQVGVRCRHCAHLPLSQRSRGSTYFPMSTLSFYQAAQHIYSKHFDCGRCTKMPQSVLVQFPRLQGAPGSVGYNSAGGRQYWSQCALDLGLINTDAGVFPHDNFHNMSLP